MLAEDLRLTSSKLDRLLTLDAPEHALLHRTGAVPNAADVAAQFNAQVLLSLLRHASEARLTLATDAPEVLQSLERLSQANDVRLRVTMRGGRSEVTLRGRQDALGSWGRHGHRLARLLVQIHQRGQRTVSEVSADLVMKQGRGQLKLTPDLCTMIAGPLNTDPWWEDGSEVSPATLPDLLRLPPRSECQYSLRRWPEPQAWASGILVPDALIKQGHSTRLVTVIRGAHHARSLAPLLTSQMCGPRLTFLGNEDDLELLPETAERVSLAPD